MAFKLLGKQSLSMGLGNDEVSVSKSSICFGDDFNALISKHKFMEVYLDEEENLVAFRPCNNSNTGYKTQFDKTSTKRPSVTSSKVTKRIPVGRYNAKLENGDMIVIKVEHIYTPKEIFAERQAEKKVLE